PVGQFVNPVVISPAFINPVVVSQVVEECQQPEPGQAHMPETTKDAQLCFACRSRAKVSSFPLADRLAERTRACNDHPLSNLYHGRMGLSSASRSWDSNQPDAAPLRRD